MFYPAVRAKLEEEDLLDEAQVEHASAKDLIEQLENMNPDDPLYKATFKVFGEYVLHHVKEEEGEMFPQVKASGLDLEALGEEMMARKEELTASCRRDAAALALRPHEESGAGARACYYQCAPTSGSFHPRATPSLSRHLLVRHPAGQGAHASLGLPW